MNPSVGDEQREFSYLSEIVFPYRKEVRKLDAAKHIKRSMYPHIPTSPHGLNLQDTTDLCLSLLVALGRLRRLG